MNNLPTRRSILKTLGGLSLGGIARIAYPQNSTAALAYPTRPIRLYCPFAAAGGVDITARAIAQKLTQAWGQPVVVENKPGANGTIAVDQAIKAAPDGYTLTMISSSHSVNVTLQKTQPYDLMRDLAPITQATIQPYVLVINPKLRIHSVHELITQAKAAPGKFTYGSSGLGGLSHLAGASFGSMANIELMHIPYKGGAVAMSDVISGQIDMLFSTILQSHGHIASGRLRGIAVTTATRSSALPQVPTMQESGLKDYLVAGWYGLTAPAATPEPILNQLNEKIVEILHTDDMRERLATDGSEPVGNSRAEFSTFIAAEIAKWRALIERLGIRPD